MSATLEHVRGDSLRWTVVRTDSAGDPAAAAGTITARFVNAMGAGITLDVESVTANTFDLVADAATTATWAPGLYRGDVEFDTGNARTSTREALQLVVRQDFANAS